jgi:hypothetical protein
VPSLKTVSLVCRCHVVRGVRAASCAAWMKHEHRGDVGGVIHRLDGYGGSVGHL